MDIDERIVNEFQIIISTAVNTKCKKLEGQKYKYIIMDEATQATQMDALIPIMQASHVTLIGDQKQLGPVILTRQAKEMGFDQSMFERLLKNGVPNTMLNTQYRMHPEISEFPSNEFYSRELADGIEAKDRKWPSNLKPFPNGSRIMFVESESKESFDK